MPKFPNILHVTVDGDAGDEFFLAHEDGVANLDKHGQKVAIYKLASVGKVNIMKTYTAAGIGAESK